MLSIMPLSTMQIDWKAYLKVATETLGKSPRAKLDERWQVPTNRADEFLATLNEIVGPGSEIANNLLVHIHIGFALVATRSVTFNLMAKTRLPFTPIQTIQEDHFFSILTGTLDQWKSAIYSCCQDNCSYDVRKFGTMIKEELGNMGFNHSMSNWNVINISDGTVRLIEKK